MLLFGHAGDLFARCQLTFRGSRRGASPRSLKRTLVSGSANRTVIRAEALDEEVTPRVFVDVARGLGHAASLRARYSLHPPRRTPTEAQPRRTGAALTCLEAYAVQALPELNMARMLYVPEARRTLISFVDRSPRSCAPRFRITFRGCRRGATAHPQAHQPSRVQRRGTRPAPCPLERTIVSGSGTRTVMGSCDVGSRAQCLQEPSIRSNRAVTLSGRPPGERPR